MTPPTTALSLDHVTKVYAGGVTALREVSLAVAQGERACLLGPNGAGKTTVVRLLEGALAPTSGRVSVAGSGDAIRLAYARAQVGIVPQLPGMYDDLRLGEYLELAWRAYGRGSPAEMADRLGLADLLTRPLATLSGGLQRRAVLAAALLSEPPILLLDEPTAGLDPVAAREVAATLREAMAGRTVLLCTHNLAEAEALCDSVIILRAGQVLLHESIQSLRAHLDSRLQVRAAQGAEAVRQALARGGEASATVEGNRVEVPVHDPERSVPMLLRRLLAEGLDVYDAALVQPTLEDLFFQALRTPASAVRAVPTGAHQSAMSLPPATREGTPEGAGEALPRSRNAQPAPRVDHIRAVMWKELRQLPRKRGAVISAIFFPLLLLLVMPVGQMLAFSRIPAGALTGARIPSGLALPAMMDAINRDPVLAFRVLSLPLAVLLTALVGPSVFAQHTVVVERERRTIELLAALPFSLPEILIAKLLTTLAVSLGVALPLFLIDAVVATTLGFTGPGDLVAMAALLVAGLGYSTAASLLVALLAGDFRTANNVSGLMIGPLIVVALGLALALPPGTAPWALAALLLALAGLALLVALRLVTVERLLR